MKNMFKEEKIVKKLHVLTMALITLIQLSAPVFAMSFSDLKENHWAYVPINEMADKGILKGYPDGTFLPDKSVTRAEFAKILVLSLKINQNETTKLDFQDVSKEHWAYDYIQIAAKYLPAYKNSNDELAYLPDNNAVREDVVAAIVMASGLENSKYDLNTLNKFSDSKQISEKLSKYIAIAVENGLIQGHSNGSFEPKGNLTRAQIAQLIKNVEKVNEKNNSLENEKNVFEVTYDTKTLKIDLGNNWEKYQYTSTNGDKNIYTPVGRYLSYGENTAYEYDKVTKETKSNSFNIFKGKKEITFKVMLKSDKNKYTTLKIKNPFYVSNTADEVYLEKSTGKNSIKEVVSTINKVKNVEYKIDNENWIVDTNSINGTMVQLIIDVEKYNDTKTHTVEIKITDEYGNVFEEDTSFKFNIEKSDESNSETKTDEKVEDINEIYFDDIKFNEKTLQLDLGENWEKYQYTSTNGDKKIYTPAVRYLIYGENTAYEYDKTAKETKSNSFDIFKDKEEITFKIMLKSDKTKYTTLKIKNPFFVSNITGDKDIEELTEKDSAKTITVESVNKIKSVSYKIDNENWVTISGSANGMSLVIYLEGYNDGKQHEVVIRVVDEFDNVSERITRFKVKEPEKEDLEFIQIAKDLISELSAQGYVYNVSSGIPDYDPYTHELNGEKVIDATSYISGVVKAYGVAHDISDLKNIQRFSSDSMCTFANSVANGSTSGAAKYFQVVWMRNNRNMNHPDGSTPSVAELQEMLEPGDIMVFYAGHRSNNFNYQNCCGYSGKGAHHAAIFEGQWDGSKTSVYSCGITPKNTDGEPTWSNLSGGYNGNTRGTLFAILRVKSN